MENTTIKACRTVVTEEPNESFTVDNNATIKYSINEVVSMRDVSAPNQLPRNVMDLLRELGILRQPVPQQLPHSVPPVDHHKIQYTKSELLTIRDTLNNSHISESTKNVLSEIGILKQ